MMKMERIKKYLETVTDQRQEKKVRHKMYDIIAIVFFAMLSNADEWVEIEMFGIEHKDFLRKYLELSNGIPPHDTIQRVFAMVSAEFLQSFQRQWNEMLNSEEGDKIRKILRQQLNIGQICRRNISWLSQMKDWVGLRSIAMTRNTIVKDGNETSETRYFISSLPLDATEIARAIRKHWMVESHHYPNKTRTHPFTNRSHIDNAF